MKAQYRSEAEKNLGPELFNDIVNALSRYGVSLNTSTM
jgi:hypothetical protein